MTLLSASKTSVYKVGGISISGEVVREESGALPGQSVDLPAGKAGTLTTRTDNDTGVATLTTGHGILENDVVDVRWATGVRYGMVAGTIATNAVPLDGGAGDNLPTQATAVVVTKQVVIDFDVVGDNIEFIVAKLPVAGHLDFQESNGTSILAVDLLANEPWDWYTDNGIANPFASKTIASVKVSNGTSVATQTLQIGGLYNSA